MFICPQCSVQLTRTRGSHGVFWRCPSCDGRSATIALLRKNIPRGIVNALWQTARSGNCPRQHHCPACNKLMAEVSAAGNNQTEYLDVCTVCQCVWFDSGEYTALPAISKVLTREKQLPQQAREKLALLELDTIRAEAQGDDWNQRTPDEWWQWIPGLLGMPVEQGVERSRNIPLVTWSIALLVTIVSVIAFDDLRNVIMTFGLVPAEADRLGGLTLLTSFFIHGGIFHLIGNMYFFLVFGDNVEDWLGTWQFFLLLLCATVIGDVFHIMGDPGSTIPCVGASGGISGIIAFYALKFPQARLGFMVRIYLWFRWVRMPAYAMFFIWVSMQAYGVWAQLAGFSNVSSLAHLGGATVGVVFWFISRDKRLPDG